MGVDLGPARPPSVQRVTERALTNAVFEFGDELLSLTLRGPGIQSDPVPLLAGQIRDTVDAVSGVLPSLMERVPATVQGVSGKTVATRPLMEQVRAGLLKAAHAADEISGWGTVVPEYGTPSYTTVADGLRAGATAANLGEALARYLK